MPYRHLYAGAPSEATFGSVERALGVLAAGARRFDDADEHLTAAIETERRMRAAPWVAYAQHDLTATLLKRNAPGDLQRAESVRKEAIESYRALGMDSWSSEVRLL